VSFNSILMGADTTRLKGIVDAHTGRIVAEQIEQIKQPTRAVWVWGYDNGEKILDTIIAGSVFQFMSGTALIRCLNVRVSNRYLDNALLDDIELCWLQLDEDEPIPIAPPANDLTQPLYGHGANHSVGRALWIFVVVVGFLWLVM